LVRGTIHGPDGRLAVSVIQELILRPYETVDVSAGALGRR
jgi:hypothetical protein